jgi:hypothetical protein
LLAPAEGFASCIAPFESDFGSHCLPKFPLPVLRRRVSTVHIHFAFDSAGLLFRYRRRRRSDRRRADHHATEIDDGVRQYGGNDGARNENRSMDEHTDAASGGDAGASSVRATP